jgi:hypothetical protein
MEIKLTPQECEKCFFDALCNVYGNGYWNGYGLLFHQNYREQYDEARKKIPEKELSVEAVWMQILRDGHKLKIRDAEGGGIYDREISLQDVYDRMEKVPANILVEAVNEQDDILTSDVILQTVFFESVIFG